MVGESILGHFKLCFPVKFSPYRLNSTSFIFLRSNSLPANLVTNLDAVLLGITPNHFHHVLGFAIGGQ